MMLNPGGIISSAALTGGTMGMSMGGMFLIVRWFAVFIGGRMDRREAHLDAATKSLIDELRVELNRLKERAEASEKRMRECEQKHADSEAKVKRLEAMFQGYGDAKQVAQLMIAADKKDAEE